MTARLTIGTRTSGSRYEGVIRRGKTVVLACGHTHHNRDTSTGANGRSARDCITGLARAARNSYLAHQEAARIRNAPNAYLRAFQTSQATATRMRDEAEKAAEAYLAGIEGVVEAIGDAPIFGYNGRVEVAPPRPADVECGGCGDPIEPSRYSAERGWFDWQNLGTGTYHCPAGSVHAPAVTA